MKVGLSNFPGNQKMREISGNFPGNFPQISLNFPKIIFLEVNNTNVEKSLIMLVTDDLK